MAGLDVLILEDSESSNKMIEWMLSDIQGSFSYKIANTSSSFREMTLEYNPSVFFLDDRVPHEEGDLRTQPSFIENFEYIKDNTSYDKAFYTGNQPSSKVKKYCSDQNIQLIDKMKIPEKISSLIKENKLKPGE